MSDRENISKLASNPVVVKAAGRIKRSRILRELVWLYAFTDYFFHTIFYHEPNGLTRINSDETLRHRLGSLTNRLDKLGSAGWKAVATPFDDQAYELSQELEAWIKRDPTLRRFEKSKLVPLGVGHLVRRRWKRSRTRIVKRLQSKVRAEMSDTPMDLLRRRKESERTQKLMRALVDEHGDRIPLHAHRTLIGRNTTAVPRDCIIPLLHTWYFRRLELKLIDPSVPLSVFHPREEDALKSIIGHNVQEAMDLLCESDDPIDAIIEETIVALAQRRKSEVEKMSPRAKWTKHNKSWILPVLE